jgi:hypothetical protein
VGLTYPDVSRKSHDFSFQGGVLDQLPFYNSPSLAYEDVRFSETPVTRPNTPHDQKLQHQRYSATENSNLAILIFPLKKESKTGLYWLRI